MAFLAFFLNCNNEFNHLRIKLEDAGELGIQPYHVIHVEHTARGFPFLTVKTAFLLPKRRMSRQSKYVDGNAVQVIPILLEKV